MRVNDEVKVNREYKDRLFRLIFGAEENKRYLLDLYNAVNHTSYVNVEDIEITTLEDVIYVKMKNDVSFLLDSELSLYEHQGSYNPNMPLRGFLYFAHLYQQILSGQKRDIYSSSLVKIPTPGYVVFYNGDRKQPDRVELKLSDAFEKKSVAGDFEWTATMLNINLGNNQELLEKCRALYEYASYVAKVKEYGKTMPLKDAVDRAVNEAIEENYLDGFFRKHKEGVVNVSLTEYNEEEFIENRRAEGREEGRKEGIKEGKMQIILKLLSKGRSCEEISDLLDIPLEEVRQAEKESCGS